MKFKFRKFESSQNDCAESEVRICSSQLEELTGNEAQRYRLKPWKCQVVRVGNSETGYIYRLIKGHGQLSISRGNCWMGPRTRSQLDIHENSEVEIIKVSQFLGRLSYYNSHLDDAVRFLFRISFFWGDSCFYSIALPSILIFRH